MKKLDYREQLIMAIVSTPPVLFYAMGAEVEAMKMACGPIIGFILLVNAERIRSNKKLMSILEKTF